MLTNIEFANAYTCTPPLQLKRTNSYTHRCPRTRLSSSRPSFLLLFLPPDEEVWLKREKYSLNPLRLLLNFKFKSLFQRFYHQIVWRKVLLAKDL